MSQERRERKSGSAPEPKPFVWIPIREQQAPRKAAPVGFEEFRNLTGRLDASFVVESDYLHIGSGAFEFDQKAGSDQPDVWHTFYRRCGQICVPGTSLKGSVRSIVEAITNSCISQAANAENVPTTHRRCPEDAKQVCFCCSLFGRTGWRGRVHFADALPEGMPQLEVVKISELWGPRKYEGRKFYSGTRVQRLRDKVPARNHRFVEAVLKGTKFRTSIFFENVAEEELGVVFHGLGWDVNANGQLVSAMMPKVGGAKPRCFGRVRWTLPTIRLWQVQNAKLMLRSTQYSAQDAIQFIINCLGKCKKANLLIVQTWNTLVQQLGTESQCPRGLY